MQDFIFHSSIAESLKNVDDATYRKMMNAIIQYCVDGTEPELDGLEEGLFTSWKGTLDTLNANRRNGKMGGRPKKSVENEEEKTPFNPLLTPLKPFFEGENSEKEETEKERSKEKEKEEKDNLNIYGDAPETAIEKLCQKEKEQQAESLFDELWKLYPKKKGKGSVSKTQKLKLLKIGREELMRCIDRFLEDHQNTEEQYLPYGSSFFNSGYVDYLDENTEPPEKPPDTVYDRFADYQ